MCCTWLRWPIGTPVTVVKSCRRKWSPPATAGVARAQGGAVPRRTIRTRVRRSYPDDDYDEIRARYDRYQHRYDRYGDPL